LACQLLSSGANPDAKDRDGISPWIQACISNRSHIKDLLLDYWKAISAGVSSHCSKPIRSKETVASAASSGDTSLLQMLRLRGAKSNIVDQQGLTPLHTAAKSGHLSAVDFLLRHANTLLDRKDSHGRTALWWSTFLSHDCVTQRLLAEKDVEINALGTCGKYDSPSTSLHHLARRRDTNVLSWFLSRPTLDPNLCFGSQTALCLAIQQGNTAVVRLLLAHEKTQINAMDIYSNSPLFLATQEGHRDIVELLVWQNDRLQINQLNGPDKETALCLAVRRGRLDLLDILLAHPQINIDTINGRGETALLLAVKREDPSMVSRLLQGPNLPCILALPTEIAQSRNNRDIYRLMQEAMKQRSHSNYSSRQR
jgi:ankyrin repeat protein